MLPNKSFEKTVASTCEYWITKSGRKRTKGEKEPREEKKAKEETRCVTLRWKIKVNRYPPHSCYSIPGLKKRKGKNNSASRHACF